MNYQSEILRSFDGGAATLGKDLEIMVQTKIGSYEPSQVYTVEIIDELIQCAVARVACQHKSISISGVNQRK